MLEYLTKDDPPESLIDIEAIIGLDNVKGFIKLVGGSIIYISSENGILKPVRNKIIK